MQKMIKTLFLTASLACGFIWVGSGVVLAAVEFNYEFAEEGCANPQHEEYTKLMKDNQGKLVEVVAAEDLFTFYHSWAESVNTQYGNDGADADRVFIFKSYPQVGLMFAYKGGCLIGAKVLPLDQVNKILEIYYTKKKKGDL